MAIKSFTSGEVLTASDTNTYLANAGLVYITEVTIGAGSNTATVSNCFSSTYDLYRVNVSGISFSSGGAEIWMQWNGSTTGNYGSLIYQLATSATVNSVNASNAAAFQIGIGGNTNGMVMADNINPVSTTWKAGSSSFTSDDSSASYGGHGSMWSTNGGTSTGFIFYGGGVTMNGGKITVYGYRKA
jgi:hypothetical protein